MPEPPPYGIIARGMIKGRLTPFLGAGVNLFGHETGDWRTRRFPSGSELAGYLANEYEYHEEGDFKDLLRVAQYVWLEAGPYPLYEDLHEIFARVFSPNPVHRFLADVPGLFEDYSVSPAFQLVVTTNYDDTLETAFEEAGQKFDLFYYRSEGDPHGRFWHRRPDGSEKPVEKPNEYEPDLLEHRPVILKIHGDVNPTDPERDSYVITEDDYIDYLAHTDISELVPKTLKARMTSSHFLFLGYSLQDWNLRAFLHRLWSQRHRDSKSWAIQLAPGQLEQRLWAHRGVQIYELPLEEAIGPLRDAFIERLRTSRPEAA
jgi:SIR2-like domain